MKPSPSASFAASEGSFGLKPYFFSQSFGMPSWSVSTSTFTMAWWAPQKGHTSQSAGIGFPHAFFFEDESPWRHSTRRSLARKFAFLGSTAASWGGFSAPRRAFRSTSRSTGATPSCAGRMAFSDWA